MNDTVRKLSVEQEAAHALLMNVRAVIGDDEQAVADTIEGETGLFEAVDDAIGRIRELQGMQEAIGNRMRDLDARSTRLKNQEASIKTALEVAMMTLELKRLERPEATLSLALSGPTLSIDDEKEIPTQYMVRSDPRPDKRALLAALKALEPGETIPGVSLNVPDRPTLRMKGK